MALIVVKECVCVCSPVGADIGPLSLQRRRMDDDHCSSDDGDEGDDRRRRPEGPVVGLGAMIDVCRCVVCHAVSVDACLCARGHLTCASCLSRQAMVASAMETVRCAVCRERAACAEALVARQVVEACEDGAGEPVLECDHEGCGERLWVQDYEPHRRSCPRRVVVCPHAECSYEGCASGMAAHVLAAHSDDAIVVEDGAPISLLATHFSLRRTIVARGTRGDAVLQLDCFGAVGRSGMHEMQHAMLRLCCVCAADQDQRWAVVMENRVPYAACEARETTRAPVPCSDEPASCRAMAYATVLADCEGAISRAQTSVAGVKQDVVAWWASLERLRGATRLRDDRVPRARRTADAPLVLLTLTLNELHH